MAEGKPEPRVGVVNRPPELKVCKRPASEAADAAGGVRAASGGITGSKAPRAPRSVLRGAVVDDRMLGRAGPAFRGLLPIGRRDVGVRLATGVGAGVARRHRGGWCAPSRTCSTSNRFLPGWPAPPLVAVAVSFRPGDLPPR